MCIPESWPPSSCTKNSPCSAPFSHTEMSSHLLCSYPPNFEAQLKCHLLPKAFLDDSNPHKSLPTPI